MSSGTPLRVDDFDYDLPPGLIAQHPLPRREDSRLMVVDRAAGAVRHGRFRELPGLLRTGDILVLNDTKVVPARLWGTSGDARIEFLFIREAGPGTWEVLCRPARRVRKGDTVRFAPGASSTVAGVSEGGRRLLDFGATDVRAILRAHGFAPLPPYIKRKQEDLIARPEDLDRYQTVFADKEGAIAAPTAGLHFTPSLLRDLEDRGVDVLRVTLDVGLATFQPVRAELVADHRMLEEFYTVRPTVARTVNSSKAEGRPVTAVGTTVVRTLESSWHDGKVRAGQGSTSLFITPGFDFHVVDRLLTNFHLPRSTLLMLVSAFAGHELTMRAYREAVRDRYRFFSYGDAMLIL